ncbi:mitochondrial sodium/hydrogen exchanger 9B2-like [Elysia marginata]|uniref:Mitochondrial sodium/hydrogen exchanger 9B2-like n=1 Tax=Elysia marginata TaxID=1093978 RepID=A0AAV4GIF5_9GAST|nr:mitochondrial sodium/hydrogen exchanger 9B2-like [Elysia marginata]
MTNDRTSLTGQEEEAVLIKRTKKSSLTWLTITTLAISGEELYVNTRVLLVTEFLIGFLLLSLQSSRAASLRCIGPNPTMAGHCTQNSATEENDDVKRWHIESNGTGDGKGDKSIDYEMQRNLNTHHTYRASQSWSAERCATISDFFHRTSRPLLASSHPLPDNPSTLRKIAQWFLCPPSGKVAAVLVTLLIFAVWWASLISMTKSEALPGGSLYPMLILFIGAWCGGYVIKPTTLPPLLGMLIVGCMLANVPGIDVAKDIEPAWSSTARSIALTVILTRAGLGLDPVALKRLSLLVLRLAFLPSLAEVVVDGVAARLILGFPWTWSFLLAFVLSVVSPAVVVPSMLGLSEKGYGLNKGIPTLVIAAVSLDAVLAITGFGVMLGICFSQGDLAWIVCKGPLEALVGIAFGSVCGVILWYFPQKSSKNLSLFRSVLLIGGGLLTIFGSKAINWSGSGPLACLSLAFVAAYRWKDEYRGTGKKMPVEDVTGVLWMVFQPLLFGLIGAAVDMSTLDADTVGLGIAVLFMGLAIRMCVASLVALRSDLNLKERFFLPLAWFPKATVQAAIGAVAYDTAVEKGETDLIPNGKKVLTIAFLAILITAPIGSAIIAMVGPKLLHRTVENTDLQGNVNPALDVEEQKGADNKKRDPTTKL